MSRPLTCLWLKPKYGSHESGTGERREAQAFAGEDPALELDRRLTVDLYVEGVKIEVAGGHDGTGAKLSPDTLTALSLSEDARLIQCVACRRLFIARAGTQSCSERCANACFHQHVVRVLMRLPREAGHRTSPSSGQAAGTARLPRFRRLSARRNSGIRAFRNQIC